MSKSRCLLALVFLVSITLVPVASRANAIHPDIPSICDHVAGNLVRNCGFETGDFTHWTVTRAPFGSSVGVSAGSEHSGNFAAFFAAVAGPDSLSQVLSTTAGRSFDLSFFLANSFPAPRGEGDFRASWDGTILLFDPGAFSFPYTQFSFVVPGTGRETLQFAGLHMFGSFLLDDVVVTPVVTPIPEPSTLSLFGLGLLFGGASLWRNKKLLSGTQA